MPQVRKVMFKQIVPVMLDWRISYSLFQYGRYIHVVIVFQWFFHSLPSEVPCIISGGYTRYCLPYLFCRNDLFTFRFCACVDDTFLVPNESVQHLLERQWEIMEENINFCRLINRFIFLVFLSTLVALNILSLYQLSLDFETFPLCLFGHFRFWVPTHFPEIICPRYGPGGIIEPLIQPLSVTWKNEYQMTDPIYQGISKQLWYYYFYCIKLVCEALTDAVDASNPIYWGIAKLI